jgi:hypothetical protein
MSHLSAAGDLTCIATDAVYPLASTASALDGRLPTDRK